MLKVRLQRRGKKNYATYRVVVADQRSPIKGKFVSDVGYYNPHTNEFKVDAEEIQKWLGNGAQASATVHNLLINNKIIKGEKVTSWTPKAKEGEEKVEGDATVEPHIDEPVKAKEESKTADAPTDTKEEDKEKPEESK